MKRKKGERKNETKRWKIKKEGKKNKNKNNKKKGIKKGREEGKNRGNEKKGRKEKEGTRATPRKKKSLRNEELFIPRSYPFPASSSLYFFLFFLPLFFFLFLLVYQPFFSLPQAQFHFSILYQLLFTEKKKKGRKKPRGVGILSLPDKKNRSDRFLTTIRTSFTRVLPKNIRIICSLNKKKISATLLRFIAID